MRRHKGLVAFGACWLSAAVTLVIVAGAAPRRLGAGDVLFGVAGVMVMVPIVPLIGLICMFCIVLMWMGLALNLAILEFVWLRLTRLGSRSPRRGTRPQGDPRTATTSPPAEPDPGGYYAALGVDPRSPHRLIRVAYRGQALRNHPDRGGSVRRMQTINEAWAVVGDPDRRRAYDAGALPTWACRAPRSEEGGSS